MIYIFLRIVEDTLCLVLAFLVDMNEISLYCLLVELNEVLLVDLTGVVES